MINKLLTLGEPSKLKSADTLEKFPSGDDPTAPYPTWDFFEIGNFLKWNDPPPQGFSIEIRGWGGTHGGVQSLNGGGICT